MMYKTILRYKTDKEGNKKFTPFMHQYIVSFSTSTTNYFVLIESVTLSKISKRPKISKMLSISIAAEVVMFDMLVSMYDIVHHSTCSHSRSILHDREGDS